MPVAQAERLKTQFFRPMIFLLYCTQMLFQIFSIYFGPLLCTTGVKLGVLLVHIKTGGVSFGGCFVCFVLFCLFA